MGSVMLVDDDKVDLEAEVSDLKEVVESKDEALRYIEAELKGLKGVFEAKERTLREEFGEEVLVVTERVEREREKSVREVEEEGKRRETSVRGKYDECKKVNGKMKKKMEALVNACEGERAARVKEGERRRTVEGLLEKEKEKGKVVAQTLYNQLIA